MTGAIGLGLAVLLALLDVAVPVAPRPRGARRLLRALPAGVLAVTLRLVDSPPLLAAALLAFAVADALTLDPGARAGVGGWTVTLLAQLLLAAALWELASPALLPREPWRAAEALVVLAGGFAVLARRRPSGPLAPLAPLPVVLLGIAAAAAGVQPTTTLALAFVAAVALWSVAAGLELRRETGGVLPARERALRSAAALALAWPLLPLPR